MNNMEQVATLLGVELGEKFRISGYRSIYYFDEKGLWREDIDKAVRSDELNGLLNGTYEIIKLPWAPKVGEKYYYCTLNFATNLVKSANFEPHYLEDAYNIKVGNCFPTKGEAEQHLEAFKAWVEGEPIVDWRA